MFRQVLPTHLGYGALELRILNRMVHGNHQIHQESCTSDQWVNYIVLVKQIIGTSFNNTLLHDGDVTILLDWVYYHDVLTRFSLRHWHRKATETEISSDPLRLCVEVREPKIAIFLLLSSDKPWQTSTMAPSAIAILEMLSQICETVPADATANTSFEVEEDYKGFLSVLEWRIRNIPDTTEYHQGAKPASYAKTNALLLRLYKLALLVYLERTCGGLLNQGIRTQQHVDEAFSILPKLNCCDRQFPAFIIGCEARTDEQRIVVLDLIWRTKNRSSSRSFNYVGNVLQAIWAQDDLATAANISYGERLSSIITRCLVTPTFV